MTDPLSLLTLTILSFVIGVLSGRLYERAVITSRVESEQVEEVERLTADKERLTAELAERERQIVALGKARLGGLDDDGDDEVWE